MSDHSNKNTVGIYFHDKTLLLKGLHPVYLFSPAYLLKNLCKWYHFATVKRRTVDKFFFILTISLSLLGVFIFTSASMGLLAREGITFAKVAFNQIFFGLFLGLIAMLATIRIDHRKWRTLSLYIFIGSLILTILVFIPGLGQAHGGAKRWLDFGPFSLQPAELMKVGFIMFYASWLSTIKSHVNTLKFGLVPLLGMLALMGIILLLQPDTGTFLIIVMAGVAMFITAGARWTHVIGTILVFALLLGGLILARPYVKDRIMTFIDPSSDPLGAGYQIQQSLIAIGSGGFTGRGFGQSVQKFNFLPEPVGDSIFAVFAEEWGFVGSLILLALFLLFALRGYSIAARAPNNFAKLFTVGVITAIAGQSFINIGAMLGVFPLTGMPLLFVSQGGTALMVTLATVGIVLNISKYKKRKTRNAKLET